MSSTDDAPSTAEPERVVIRDNRKIDRVTQATAAGGGDDTPPPAAGPGAEPATEAQEVPMVEAALLDERTADLQRVQAEYANYRRRADRERLLAGDAAVGRVLADLLPVLDDLDRARAHGDVTGPLKAVADKLDGFTAKLGLARFGEVGDPFDPAIHEAVLHDESDAVTEPSCTTIMRPGYRHNDRLLRPAMVGVTDPATPTSPDQTAAGDPATAGDPNETPPTETEKADEGDHNRAPES